MNLPRVGPREWNLSIATTPETFKLPWDWDMLSICIWDYWCPQKGWTNLRWQGMCSEAPMEGWCTVNPIGSKMQGPQMILCYTSSVLHNPFTVPRNGWEKRRRVPKRSQHSTRQLRESSCVSRQFQPNIQHHIFETSIQLEGSMVGECLAWTSYFWRLSHTCYSICDSSVECWNASACPLKEPFVP